MYYSVKNFRLEEELMWWLCRQGEDEEYSLKHLLEGDLGFLAPLNT